MQKATINLETLSCPSCLQKIENALKGLDGVEKESVEVLFNSSRVRTNFDPESITIETIERFANLLPKRKTSCRKTVC